MSTYVIKGGKKLKGSIEINASKNAAVAILIASLLNEGKTTINKLSKIEEVFRIIEVLESIGVQAKWVEEHSLEVIPPKKFNLEKINIEAAEKTRSIIMFIGALAGKMDKFFLPASGGCKLGKRSINPHIYALEDLGIKIKEADGKLNVLCSKFSLGRKDREIILYESGDTVTENAIMAAALIPGKTTIKFASANYQVQDLCYFLQGLGVKFEGIGLATLVVRGVSKIKKDFSYALTEDPIESMFFITAAIMTGSSIVIKKCPMEFLELELFKLKKMGFRFKILKEYKADNGFSRLADIKTFSSKLKAPIEKISARPFPGLNIDNLPFFVPIATQAEGQTLIHDWVYENRAIYYTELKRLGADINLADPHRVFIMGPSELKATEMMCPPALRPSAIILATMLAAEGTSVLKNTYAIERGYEDLCGRLKKMGAEIEKLEN